MSRSANRSLGILRVSLTWMLSAMFLAALMLAAVSVDPKGGGNATGADAADSSLYIPATAHVSGAAGTNWRTDVEIFNFGTEQATYEIALLKKNQANPTPTTVTFSLNQGVAVRYDDILESVFGFNGSAALRITASSGELVVTSRTYNQTPSGTYGQFIGAVPEERAIVHGELGRIVQLAHHRTTDAGYRTNVGFVNSTATEIVIRARLFDGDGTELGARSYTLGPYMFRQIDRIFSQVTQDVVADGYVMVETTTTGGRFFAYASVVDNRTADPIYIPAIVVDVTVASSAGRPAPPTPTPAGSHDPPSNRSVSSTEPVYIAATAHVAGAAGTNWRTDLELHNPGPSAARYEIALLETNRNNSSPTTTILRVDPGACLRLEDVLTTVFDFDGTAALRVTPLGGAAVLATSRTYNLTDQGTYGQFVGGVTDSDAIGDDNSGLMIQLTHHRDSGAGYRSNIGCLNCGASPIDIRIELFRADGSRLGTVEDSLGPYTHKQINRIFQQVTGGDTDDGYAIITTTSDGGRFLAYASVVDNATGDPVYNPAIPAVVVEPPPPTPTPTVGPGATLEPLPVVQDIFDWFGTKPGQGNVRDLEEAVADFQNEGIDALLDEAADFYPATATRTTTGVDFDFGNGYVFNGGATASGRFSVSFTSVVNSASRVSFDFDLDQQQLQVNGTNSPVDSIVGTLDFAVDQAGHVAGSATFSGSGGSLKTGTVNTITGEIEVDTLLCRYFPVSGAISFEIDGQRFDFTFTPACDGSFDYSGPAGVDLSQFHTVALAISNVTFTARYANPVACGPDTHTHTVRYTWGTSDGSFIGNAYEANWDYVQYGHDFHKELTLAVNSSTTRIDSFEALEQVVDPSDPNNVVTTTVTFSGGDIPTACTTFGCSTLFAGVGTCDKISIQYQRSSSGDSCMWIADALECDNNSGITIDIY